MGRLTITEPHPTVPQNSYTHSGRGGAGNYFRAPKTTPAAGVPTTASTASPSTGRFYSGRGGAGNAHASTQRPTMSFEELYKVQSHIEEKPQGHVGRGGAGNVYNTRKGSDAASHRSSFSSTDSSKSSGFLARLSQTISRH